METEEGQKFIEIGAAIIATGSKPALPAAFDLGHKQIMTSTEALELEEIPETLFVIDGGYIGLELRSVYSTLKSKVVLVEAAPSLLPRTDPDLVRPVRHFAEGHFENVRRNTKVLEMATAGKKIRVNEKQETRTPDAIGDVCGGMLLAHKASKEGRIAVGITGHGAGELTAEGVFAIEMGATAKDLAESIHPHPTVSETPRECAESFYGDATHFSPNATSRA